MTMDMIDERVEKRKEKKGTLLIATSSQRSSSIKINERIINDRTVKISPLTITSIYTSCQWRWSDGLCVFSPLPPRRHQSTTIDREIRDQAWWLYANRVSLFSSISKVKWNLKMIAIIISRSLRLIIDLQDANQRWSSWLCSRWIRETCLF